MSESPPIVCISHLAWERTLFQRPQQIMSRMVQRGHSVLYVSKISSKRWAMDWLCGKASSHRSGPDEHPDFRNLPWVPLANRLAPMRAIDEWRTTRLILRWLGGRTDATLWLYHPDILPYVGRIPHLRLVYDVMDHFRAFKQSKSGVVNNEDRLLERADAVFTGGRSMHEPVVARRSDAQCFPSGIDLDHFGAAREPGTPIPPDVSGLQRPVLGYFGAVDERLDFDLIRGVCRLRPDWSVVFLGPVIPGTELDIEEPNFHWLGPKPYAQLPAYVRGFDVCIMPWANTELTAHLSPTKTPEYLAGGKPVVSVPIPDVRRDYGDVVFFGDTPETFVDAAESALAERDRDWAATLAGREAARTWDQIAQKMDQAIAGAGR